MTKFLRTPIGSNCILTEHNLCKRILPLKQLISLSRHSAPSMAHLSRALFCQVFQVTLRMQSLSASCVLHTHPQNLPCFDQPIKGWGVKVIIQSNGCFRLMMMIMSRNKQAVSSLAHPHNRPDHELEKCIRRTPHNLPHSSRPPPPLFTAGCCTAKSIVWRQSEAILFHSKLTGGLEWSYKTH